MLCCIKLHSLRCILTVKDKHSFLMFITEKELQENPEETEKVLNGEVEMELQADIDLLTSELEERNKEIATKQEQVIAKLVNPI